MNDLHANHFAPKEGSYSDSERLEELMYNPQGAAHMFTLLALEKGTQESFIKQLDRIITARRNDRRQYL